jgi:hypothetical protein
MAALLNCMDQFQVNVNKKLSHIHDHALEVHALLHGAQVWRDYIYMDTALYDMYGVIYMALALLHGAKVRRGCI